jgi:HSP20 family protein
MGAKSNFFLTGLSCAQPDCWQPAVDIYRGQGTWLVKCDLAGVHREDIRIQAQGKLLIISGHRRDWVIVEGHRAYSLEISYDRFERRIEMPCEVEQCMEISTDYRDGMLLITLRMKHDE